MKELLIYICFLLSGIWFIKKMNGEFKYLLVPSILWFFILVVFILLLPVFNSLALQTVVVLIYQIKGYNTTSYKKLYLFTAILFGIISLGALVLFILKMLMFGGGMIG